MESVKSRNKIVLPVGVEGVEFMRVESAKEKT